MASQIDLVVGWDWQGVYINEKLIFEEEVIAFDNIMPLLLFQSFDSFKVWYADGSWLNNIGSLPRNLGDVRVHGGTTIREWREQQE